ncbi:hypothetical protein JDW14_06990 [Tuanshanicoccus yangjingiae]|uniref:hypothetical protein n=1 Tax=Aerococcaceae bacterium zg-252 TaxID=2796928 RepID=UPI0013BABE95|nr:hypothetical protein [Facklamia sp. 253]QQD65065.1 hypothetical protein JDW14_06990 [Aerococcaceae bacterium zg-252]
MTYEQFMKTTYLPFYQSEVNEQTYSTRHSAIHLVIKRFGRKKLKDISVLDVQNFRTWLLSKIYMPTNDSDILRKAKEFFLVKKIL